MRIWQSGSVGALFLTLLCVLAVANPLFAGPGPVNTRGGGDSPFLLVRLQQLMVGLRSGAFPVRWMPNAAYGLGYPFFEFYASLPYYLAAAFQLLGWGPIRALQATQLLGFLLAAVAMALLARRVLRRPAAVALATVAYTTAPFHLVNVYVRGDSLSEFYAFVFYPLIILSLLHLCDTRSRSAMAGLGASLGGLILTHNLSALMFAPFVLAFALWLLWSQGSSPATQESGKIGPPLASVARIVRPFHRQVDWQLAGQLLLAGLLGLALSASLWLTVLGELDQVWMGIKDIQTTGTFNYASNFRRLGLAGRAGDGRGDPLIQPSLFFDYQVTASSTPFAMGGVQAGTIVLGLAALLTRWLQRKENGGEQVGGMAWVWVVGFAASTLMITSASQLLWKWVPVLPIIQFPWRFLSIQAFWGALIVGEIVEWMPRPWWWATIGAVALGMAAVGGLRPEYLPVGETDVDAQRLALFESFTTNIGTTIRGEYLPVAVEPRPWASAVTLHRGNKPPPVALSGKVEQAVLLARDAVSERWEVNVVSAQARLAFHTLYFPGWQARIEGAEGLEGQELAIEPVASSGLISVLVPQGRYAIELSFGRTFVRWIADCASLVAVGMLAVLLWPHIAAVQVPWRHIATALAATVAFLGVLVLLGGLLSAASPVPRLDDLSMDFDRMPFLHHNPDGIAFGHARLGSYEYDSVVNGGDTLRARLKWAERDGDLVASVQLVSPASVHPDLAPGPPPIASASAHVEASTTIHSLAIPRDVATGPYYVTLRLFDGDHEIQAVTTRGNALGTTYLRPVWIENPRPALPTESEGILFGDRILLGEAQVWADEGNWVAQLTWQATAPIAANYTCSLHLLAADGRSLAQRDFEGGPGYGFWPTSAWSVGEWFTDRLRVAMPSGTRVEDAVALSVVLYDRSQPGFPALGSTLVPVGERTHRYVEPSIAHRIDATFGDQLELLGYDLGRDAASLRLQLYWRSLRKISVDSIIFVHLIDPTTEAILTQSDSRPQGGTYSTLWWEEGEIVSDEIVLSLEDVPVGQYRVAIGVYDAQSKDRFPVTTVRGQEGHDGRLFLDDEVWIP